MKVFSGTALGLLSALPLVVACGSSGGGHAQQKSNVSPGDSTPADSGTAPQAEKGKVPCGLSTKFMGDDLCIQAPDPEDGMQIHMGPADYDDPEEIAQYLVQPGVENVECHYQTLDNEAMYFYDQYYRMRPGSHHLFVELSDVDKTGWVPESECDGAAMLIAGTQRSVYDFPAGGVEPPEDRDLGRPIGANAKIMLQAHFVNTTDVPVLREAWVNFMKVKTTDTPRLLGGITMFAGVQKSFGPNTVTTTDYSCENKHEDRRIVSLFGHRHAHTTQFTAWVEHPSGAKDLVYQDWDWHEPTELMFNSVTMNPAPDPMAKKAGGTSGMLVLAAGDKLDWQCIVNNDSDNTLTFSNEVYKGEMCNVFGSIVATDGTATWTCLPELNSNN